MSFFFDKSNSIFIKSAQSNGEPYKAKDDIQLEMAKNQGEQAQELSKYEEEKGEVKGLLRSYGLTDQDIEFIESFKLPKDLLLEMTKKVIEAVNQSGLSGQFDNWFKLATQSYFNTRNWTITEQLLSTTAELQGKYVNFPILGSMLSALKGQTSPELISIMNSAFAEDQKDANIFKSMIGLAQLSPKSTEEEAYFAYKQMLDNKTYQADLTERAKGLTDMLQSSAYLAEEARMLEALRKFYEGANLTAPIRAWRGVLRALNLGQNIKAQGTSMISGAGSGKENKQTGASSKPNIRIALDASSANLIKDFVAKWPEFYRLANIALMFNPNKNQISQGLQIIDQAVKSLSTAKYDNTPEDNAKVSQSIANLAQSTKYIPQLQQAQQESMLQAQKVASDNTRNVLAQDAATNLGQGFGYGVGGATMPLGLAGGISAFMAGDYNRALSILGSTATAIINTINEQKGSAKVEGLTSPELKNQRDAISVLNAASGQSELMNKYFNLIEQFSKDQNNFKELIDSTKSSVVSIGTGQAGTNEKGVLGSPTQVFLTYQNIITKLKKIIEVFDRYLAIYNSTLEKIKQNPAAFKQPGQTDEDVSNFISILEYNSIRYKNLRMKAVSFYTDIYSISKIADKIQQQNEILQKMKAIDTQAKGVSEVLGPGALQQVLLGENGIYDRVQKIRALEIDAKNKLTQDLRDKQKMLQKLKQIKQNQPQASGNSGGQV